jgi:acyl-CoA thioesterase-1
MLRILSLVAIFLLSVQLAFAKPVTLLVLGDSLTAGLGLAPQDAFPAKLEAALKPRYPDLTIVNAGVSGDTAADGLARLDWALTDEVGGLIVGLGANDALRGLDAAQTEMALDGIMLKAPPNMGPDYVARFDGLFPRLAEKHGALLYPFFLDGVAANGALNQADGIHPNAEGVNAIVMKVMPHVEDLIGKMSVK